MNLVVSDFQKGLIGKYASLQGIATDMRRFSSHSTVENITIVIYSVRICSEDTSANN